MVYGTSSPEVRCPSLSVSFHGLWYILAGSTVSLPLLSFILYSFHGLWYILAGSTVSLPLLSFILYPPPFLYAQVLVVSHPLSSYLSSHTLTSSSSVSVDIETSSLEVFGVNSAVLGVTEPNRLEMNAGYVLWQNAEVVAGGVE